MTLTLADLLPLSDNPADWDTAACRGDEHPDRWFPDPSESFEYAAGVCGRCPMMSECAAFAAETAQSGVWGGHEYRRGKVIR